MLLDLRFDPDAETVAAARQCEHDVFLRAYGNTAEQWAQEYGPYESNSVFLTVSEPGGDVLAASRLILPGAAGFKSLIDARGAPWFLDAERAAQAAGLDLARTWDVATIAVRPKAARSGLLAAALYHGIYRAAIANDARWLVMIMDVRARRLLDVLHLTSNVLPTAEPGPYLGSAASVPLWADIVAMWDVQRRDAPQSHRLVTLGVGLDGIAIPSAQDFLLRSRRRPDERRDFGSDRVRVGEPVRG